jgi:hypothetical protein|nr:MAG TPA: protein of unknown function (DUF4962) [Caudoviricetes sp.]
MYQDFSVIAIDPNYAEKKVVINTSFDIDPDSVDERTIQLFSKANRCDANIDFEVKDKTITVLVKEDIVPNTNYIIKITGIKTILGDVLSTGVRRTITFKSMVREIPYIISPSDYEEIVDLKVTLKAILEDEEFESLEDKSYFIQIAEDVAFINVVLETRTNESTVNLKNLKTGQYYIRARVEAFNEGNKDFGKWSETVSFISLNKAVEEECPDDSEDDEPIFIEDISLVNKPANGETPESILLEFSGEVDPDFIDNIIVIRRDI